MLRLPGVAASVEEKSKRRPRGRQLAVVGRAVENVLAVLGVLREPVQQVKARYISRMGSLVLDCSPPPEKRGRAIHDPTTRLRNLGQDCSILLSWSV